jgi:hypothetical protein
MSTAFLKQRRTRLTPQGYGALRREILKRDSWRCQSCGKAADLQVHHIESRGQLGSDLEQNLITLCSRCHESLHRGPSQGSQLCTSRFAVRRRRHSAYALFYPPVGPEGSDATFGSGGHSLQFRLADGSARPQDLSIVSGDQ